MAWDIADEDLLTFDTYEAFKEAVEDLEGRVGEIVDVIQEKQDNIESGFGHTEIQAWYDLDERRGLYEEWMDSVSSGLNDIDEDEFDGDYASDVYAQLLGECPE